MLLAKFEKNFVVLNQWRQNCSLLQIIEPMMSKWRQKCSPLLIFEPLSKETCGRSCVTFGEQKELISSFKSLKIFWILSNKAIIDFSLCMIWRILQISEGTLILQNFSYPTQPHPIISKYINLFLHQILFPTWSSDIH